MVAEIIELWEELKHKKLIKLTGGNNAIQENKGRKV